jgi:hypothetical protein
MKHFCGFWPQALRFYHDDEIVAENGWSRILNLASHTNTKVTIELRMGYVSDNPTLGRI